MSNSIFFITGPTGIGKSNLAIKLSKEINGEILNADSMQIYKELKIITARPTDTDNKLVNHHLYGYVSGAERYNLEKWCNDASNIINKLHKDNKTPILVGGSGLYIETLINGLASIPTIPESVKKETNDLFNKTGIEEFYNLIKKIDYESLKKISKNDAQRLKRIWEVYKYTGKKLSIWKKNNNKKFLNIESYRIFLFIPDREKNYERVNKRVVSMINNGAIEEIENLLKNKFSKDLPVMKAHGVPEISLYLENKIDLDQCIKNIQLVTRHYVKRQNTWWRSSKLPILEKINEFPDEIDLKSTNLPIF